MPKKHQPGAEAEEDRRKKLRARQARQQRLLTQALQQALKLPGNHGAAELTVSQDLAEAARSLLDLQQRHSYERRDLEDDIRRSREAEPGPEAGVRWPRAALLLRDTASIAYWHRWADAHIIPLDNSAFVEKLEVSTDPSKRAEGLPEFHELMALQVVCNRVEEIRNSYDTDLQQRLRKLLMPTKTGRRQDELPAPESLAEAKKFTGVLLSELQDARSTGKDYYQQRHSDVVQRALTEASEATRQNLIAKGATDSPYWAALRIASEKYGIAIRRLKQGGIPQTKAAKAKAPQKRTRRLVTAVADVVRVQHARREAGKTETANAILHSVMRSPATARNRGAPGSREALVPRPRLVRKP